VATLGQMRFASQVLSIRPTSSEMKNYLLTWYGLTDLRAALGFEESDGPVLSALRSREFSDVIILAYTDPDKPQKIDDTLLEEWEERVTTPEGSLAPVSRAYIQEVVDLVCNTHAGHDLFGQWLQGRLLNLGINVTIQITPQKLKKLNDAVGIYQAATAAVETVLRDESEKYLTTHISPGTPVMAYTWALIARSNPHLKIRVISNSDPRNPPERIELPKTLLNSAINPSAERISSLKDYDLVIHLLGEQTIPVLFGVRQFRSKNHLILTTKEFESEARRLAKAIDISTTPVVVPDPFKPADTRRAIAKQVGRLIDGARVAVNMTGGTKLMFAGALSACWELGLDPFYFEIKKHDVIFLRDGSRVPFVGISDVKDFFDVENYRIVSSGRSFEDSNFLTNARSSVTHEIWERRHSLSELYREPGFQKMLKETDRFWGSDVMAKKFSFVWSSGEASFDGHGAAHLVLGGKKLDVASKDFFSFLSGGWLEDYVYGLLRPLEIDGTIRGLRVGPVVGFSQNEATDRDLLAQEFDCIFTDGKRMWIIECKAGNVLQEAIQKLENNLRVYGGVASKGILVSSKQLNRTQKTRVERSASITFIDPNELSTEALRRIVLKA